MNCPKLLLAAAVSAALLNISCCAQAPEVSAGSAILIHADTGTVLYDRCADERCLIASTTKIMTAIVALENCTGDELVVVTDESAGIEGSSMYLKAGESYTVTQLLYGMMLVSGNDAASALAVHTAESTQEFAALMNDKAEQLGMKGSHFTNPHGLDEDGHYSTARDLAVLTAYCLQNEQFKQIVSTRSFTLGENTYVNHNKLLWSLDGCIGVKTGYTKASGRSLVSSVERGGMRLICVTLGAPDDWDDHRALYDWAFSNWSWKPAASGMLGYQIPVVSGKNDFVNAVPGGEQFVLLPKGAGVDIAAELPRFVFAPVAEGEVVGRLSVSVDGAQIGSIEMIAGEGVPLREGVELTAWERFARIWSMAVFFRSHPYYFIGEKS